MGTKARFGLVLWGVALAGIVSFFFSRWNSNPGSQKPEYSAESNSSSVEGLPNRKVNSAPALTMLQPPAPKHFDLVTALQLRDKADLNEVHQAEAQSMRNVMQARRQQYEKLKASLTSGQARTFQNMGQGAVIVPNLWALPVERADEAKGFDVVGESAGHIFFSIKPDQAPPQGSLVGILTHDNQVLAVLTGALSIRLNDPRVAEELGREFRLNHRQTFEGIRTSFYQSENRTGAELVELVQQLRKDPRVIQADLSVVEKIYATR